MFDQYLQITKIAMSPSYFYRNLVYLFSESKGRLIFPQTSILLLSKVFQKQPYNWVIRFTLVIIINNIQLLSKIFIDSDFVIIIYIPYTCLRVCNKLVLFEV